MSPKKVSAGYSKAAGADDASDASSEPDVATIETMFAQMAIDEFREEVASSSGDTLKSLLPNIIQQQEDITAKMKIVKDKIREQDSVQKKAMGKEKAAEKKEKDKQERAERRNAPISFMIMINNVPIEVDATGATTFGEVRRLAVQRYNALFPRATINKKDITKIGIIHHGTRLHEHPRATIRTLKIENGCHLEAFTITHLDPADEQNDDDDNVDTEIEQEEEEMAEEWAKHQREMDDDKNYGDK